MNCPKCKKPMDRVSRADKKIVRWRCINPDCPVSIIIEEGEGEASQAA